MSRGPTLVAFDLGGVLVDVDREGLAGALQRLPEEIERAFFGAHRHDHLTVGALSGEAYVAAVAADLGAREDDVARAWRQVVTTRPGAAAIVSGVVVEVAAWSNTDALHYAELRPTLPERLWTRRALSQEVRAAKPEESFYRAALARLGCNPREVLFLDDLAANVAGAAACGVQAVQVTSLEEVAAVLAAHDLLQPS
ncbi:MAG: HAD-IA family hydrolase [Myxococcota bacterium]